MEEVYEFVGLPRHHKGLHRLQSFTLQHHLQLVLGVHDATLDSSDFFGHLVQLLRTTFRCLSDALTAAPEAVSTFLSAHRVWLYHHAALYTWASHCRSTSKGPESLYIALHAYRDRSMMTYNNTCLHKHTCRQVSPHCSYMHGESLHACMCV
jgi:hypothetical protein